MHLEANGVGGVGGAFPPQADGPAAGHSRESTERGGDHAADGVAAVMLEVLSAAAGREPKSGGVRAMTEDLRAGETSLAQVHTEEEGLATAEYGIVMLARVGTLIQAATSSN